MTLYRIKPPVWVEVEPDYWEWYTSIGEFAVGFVGYKCRVFIGPRMQTCDSIEDGKTKAEAYYCSRLLAALEPVEPQVVGTPDFVAGQLLDALSKPDPDRPAGGE